MSTIRNLDTKAILNRAKRIVPKPIFSEKPFLNLTLHLFFTRIVISEGVSCYKAVVETVPHPRRKNATPLLGKVLTYGYSHIVPKQAA
ncbi:hypothetical protein C6502_13475 [Candidatus Poribacteria bacterium]|nr:MAG: hypothetical protein C6502_13475 [Candidatus Poribacteria bacterium]